MGYITKFSKEETPLAEKHLNVQHPYHQEIQNCFEIFILYLPEWLRSIKKVTAHAGEDVEEREH